MYVFETSWKTAVLECDMDVDVDVHVDVDVDVVVDGDGDVKALTTRFTSPLPSRSTTTTTTTGRVPGPCSSKMPLGGQLSYRRPVPVGRTRLWAPLALVASLAGCTSVDPGANFVVPNETFDPDYFYCHVEPQLIVAYKCGPGDPSKGDPPNSNGCHFSSAVSGMALRDHPAVDCGGGDHPLDPTQTAGAAQTNLESVSIDMSRDYQTAPVYVRPLGHAHPRAIFADTDTRVRTLLSTWAAK
jgi:hypothetical protein